MSVRDSILGLIIILVWGFNFVVIAWGLENFPPLLMGGLRFALLAVVGSMLVANPKIPWRLLCAFGLTIGFGQFALLFSAMSFGMPAGLASLVLQAQMLFTLLFARVFLHETITPYQILAIGIAACGLALIGGTDSVGTMTAIGFGLTLAGAACWAAGNIVNRQISLQGYNSSVGLVVWSAWIPPLPFFLMSYWVEGPELIIASLQSFNWVSAGVLIYLTLAASVLGYGLWGYLFSRYPASTVAPLTLGVPVFGLASAGYFLDEHITLMQWYGVILVLVGLVFNMKGEALIRLFLRHTSAKV